MPLPFADSSDREFVELLGRARLGEADALGALIDRYRLYLLKIANDEADSNLQGKEGNSDVVQDAYTQAIQAFQQFHGVSAAELRAWLRGILLNRLDDQRDRYHARKRNVSVEVPLADLATQDSRNEQLAADQTSPSSLAVHREERELLEAALQELPEEDRVLLELRQKEGWSFADIAQKMGLSEAAAQKRWARAVQALKERVARRHG